MRFQSPNRFKWAVPLARPVRSPYPTTGCSCTTRVLATGGGRSSPGTTGQASQSVSSGIRLITSTSSYHRMVRATVSVLDSAQRTGDIWIYDVARGLRTRFTFDSADELGSVWSPDGARIAFNSRRNGTLDIFEHASSGAGGDEPVLVDKVPKFPLSWSRDGRFLLYMGSGPGTGNDLLVLPLTGDRRPFPFLQ